MRFKYFAIGFLVTNIIWITVLSLVTIPEYTIIHEIQCKRTMI